MYYQYDSILMQESNFVLVVNRIWPRISMADLNSKWLTCSTHLQTMNQYFRRKTDDTEIIYSVRYVNQTMNQYPDISC